MADFLTQNLATIVISVVLVLFVALAIRSVVKSKKKGACAGCSGCASRQNEEAPCCGCHNNSGHS
ncbi:MAG TPA: FeoB-associated Cys-rich membrane protein [Clostridia bacterium]|nr:FeoB-associated Cys-rich membrane protein [Clostridia bacterium]